MRNWQAAEKGYLGLKGLTSLLDNELGFKIMTLQSHHLRTEKKVQVLLSVSENISIAVMFKSLRKWPRIVYIYKIYSKESTVDGLGVRRTSKWVTIT